MNKWPRRPARGQRGFTLLETGIAVTLMAMIFVGAISLFVTMLRTSMRTQSEVAATASAANALQYMMQQSREAYDFKLPQETSTIQPGGGQAYTETFQGIPSHAAQFNVTCDPNYQASFTLNGVAQVINTATLLYMPLTDASSVSFYKSDGVSVQTFTPNGDVNHSLYWRGSGTPGVGILYYRSDAGGVPDPLHGQYLWMYALDGSVNKALVELFDTSADAYGVPNAVQFDRPSSLPFQLEMKIVCGNYSPINGVQTNESTNSGDTTALTGKCVLMRDHVTLTDQLGAGGNYSIPADNKYDGGT